VYQIWRINVESSGSSGGGGVGRAFECGRFRRGSAGCLFVIEIAALLSGVLDWRGRPEGGKTGVGRDLIARRDQEGQQSEKETMDRTRKRHGSVKPKFQATVAEGEKYLQNEIEEMDRSKLSRDRS